MRVYTLGGGRLCFTQIAVQSRYVLLFQVLPDASNSSRRWCCDHLWLHSVAAVRACKVHRGLLYHFE